MRQFARLLIMCLLAWFLTACNTTSDSTAEITAATLADFQVVDLEGDTVAEVEEVLLDAESGRISYAVVILERGAFRYSKAAFVASSTPRTAVPWAYFTVDTAAEQLLLQVDKSVLYAAPRLVDEPDHLRSDWDLPVRAYWQDQMITG